MQVSKVIRKYGYDLAYVADKMGLSKASLAKSVSNSGNPAVSKLRKIAEIVGCDLVEFFEDESKAIQNDAAPAAQNSTRIAQIMKDKGLSVNEVAKKMGVLPQSLSRTIRNGSCRPSTLKAVADAIGCDIKEITEGVQGETSPVLVCPYCGKEIEATISLHAHK